MSPGLNLKDHIRSRCPLSVADYMRICAEHYYATRDPFGSDGDFTTAPEISQIFGELVGAWMAQMWVQAGSPKAAWLCELGPGRGTLMKDALRATAKAAGFHDALQVVMVEASPFLQAKQKQLLQDAHPRIAWRETLEDLPALPLFLIANEFFDALPVHQYVITPDGRKERMIHCTPEGLAWSGDVVHEASPESQAIVADIARHIRTHGGAALIIDYDGFHDLDYRSSLQALHRHRHVHPLEMPGEADITAHVDSRTLLQTATATGACAWGVETQGMFFERLGARLRAHALCRNAPKAQQQAILSGLERIISPHAMGKLFKVMAITYTLDTPPGF